MKSHAVILALCLLVPCITSAQSGLDKYRSGTSRSMLTLDPQLRIGTVLTPDVDLITMDAGPVLIAPYRPRISFIKPHVMGPQSAILIEPGDNTPHVSLMNTGANGMDGVKVFYGDDFPIGFDITYTVNQGKVMEKYQDMTGSMTREKQYLPTQAEELEKIIVSGIEDSFLKKYRINQGEEVIRFGDDLQDITVVKHYDKATPKLQEAIVSGSLLDQFLLELNLVQSKRTISNSNLTQNLVIEQTFDKATPALTEKLLSGNMGLSDFFLTSFNLSDLSASSKGGNLLENIEFTVTFDKLTPKLKQKISSDNAGLNSFFEITYDLQTGMELRKFADLAEDVVFVTTYNKTTPEMTNKIFSNSAQGSFDITWNISNPLRPIGTVVVQGTGAFAPLKEESQYDVASRRIKTIYFDQSVGGLSHSLEHQLLPDPMTGMPTLEYAGGTFIVPMLRINGGGGLSFMCAGNAEITGDVTINGNLDVVGGMKNFRIDHPLDPENKYLIHSCVESPDMMNIYNGNITTDERGLAEVELPDYFEALNENFRYQLTCIGQFAQAIISEEVSDNHFTIRTDKPNVEVSWQVTGVRHDEAAMRYRVPIEGEK